MTQTMLSFRCKHCHKPFKRTLAERGNPNKYCSMPCYRLASRVPKTDGKRALLKHLGASRRGALECWPWAGYVAKNGYGYITVSGKTMSAHRAVLAFTTELMPPSGYDVHHRCNNPPCVNPAHLSIVPERLHVAITPSASTRNRTKTHCPLGHPYSGSNLVVVVRKSGHRTRRCRSCEQRKRKARG